MTPTCRSVDRVFLQGYLPKLQSAGYVAQFLLGVGVPLPELSGARKVFAACVREIGRWAEATSMVPGAW